MATKFQVHVEPWRDIDYLNDTVLPDMEPEWGPLVEISADSNSTVLTLEAGEPPSIGAKISRHSQGQPQIPADATLIDEGTIFLKGEVVLCAAYRPEA